MSTKEQRESFWEELSTRTAALTEQSRKGFQKQMSAPSKQYIPTPGIWPSNVKKKKITNLHFI